MHRVSLRNRERKTVESLPQLAQAIRRLTRQAFPEMSADIRETMARDSFIDALGTAEEVHQARPKTLNDALSAAVEQESFFAADKQRGGAARSIQTPSTQNPPETGLQQEVTELKALIRSLAEQNTMSNNARSSRQRTRGPSGCWSCGQKGHFQRNCPQQKPQQSEQQQGNENLSGSRA